MSSSARLALAISLFTLATGCGAPPGGSDGGTGGGVAGGGGGAVTGGGIGGGVTGGGTGGGDTGGGTGGGVTGGGTGGGVTGGGTGGGVTGGGTGGGVTGGGTGGGSVSTFTLTVTTVGNGTVTSIPSGISCGSDCSEAYPGGTTVSLVASANAGATFTGWSNGCTGTGICTLTLTAAETVTATFAVVQFPLTVVTTGTGTGAVMSSPAGINCGSSCSASFDTGTSVTLTATPTATSTFTGWSGGGCSGAGTCTTVISAATAVVANFAIVTFPVTVTLAGTGTGTVASTPPGISCGADCTEPWTSGSTVVLAATPAAGSSFAGWTGDCTGTGACILTLSAAANVTATFTLDSYLVTVARAGNGSGSVVSTPTGINCGADCTESWQWGTTVQLTASPFMGSVFAGWTGVCSGTGPCTVTVSAITTVVATFTLTTHDLTVVRTGAGTGQVSSTPTGINCGADCVETYDYGTSVVLTAASAGGSIFTGWSGGGCSGTGTCTVTMTTATVVTAAFAPSLYTLTVTRTGTGTGAITSMPAGITCGTDCTEPYASGTVVVLTAAPSVGSTFVGWSGAGCSGTGTCIVTVTAATTVTATFDGFPTITIARTGPASTNATVTSSPAGISCGATCTGSFAPGTVVTLTQVASGSVFNGWSGGGCAGTGNCTFTVGAAATITASYRALRVAIESPAGSCHRAAGNVIPRVTALLTARGHTVTVVAGAEIDTAPELALYDVVVIGSRYSCGVVPDLAAFDPVIDAWVRTSGGGLVAQGWGLYENNGTPGINGVLPTVQFGNYLSGAQTVVPVAGHPVTSGVTNFVANEWLPWGGGMKVGATALLMVGSTNVSAGWAVGVGRSVFAGPMFLEDFGSYNNESLVDGTQISSIEFFMRAIEWSGKAR